MITKRIILTIASVIILGLSTKAQVDPIFPLGIKAANVHHQGDVYLSHVSASDSEWGFSVANAAFAPGAKLNWHLHPAGQQLLVTEGIGLYQERGKKVQIIRKGDLIKCTTGVEHWHGATISTPMTYLAITGNKPTVWAEPVPDSLYANLYEESLREELLDLSKDKWQWMADKNTDKLSELFDDQSMFVHMGGSWGKEQEINIIKGGMIHYKKAEVFETTVKLIDQTAIVLSRISLLAVVGGNEVTNPFEVTEVYVLKNGNWKLGSLSFTRLMTPGDQH